MKLCLVVAVVLVGLAVVDAGRDHRERKGGNGKVLVHVAKKLAPGLANKIPSGHKPKPKGYKPKRHGRRRRRRCGRRNLWKIARRIAFGLSGGRRRVGICDSLKAPLLDFYCKHASERKARLNNLIENAERKVQFLTETTPAACAVTGDDEPTPDPANQAILDQIAEQERLRDEAASNFADLIEVATNGTCEQTLRDEDGVDKELQSLECIRQTLAISRRPLQRPQECIDANNVLIESEECTEIINQMALDQANIIINANAYPPFETTEAFVGELESARDETLAGFAATIKELNNSLSQEQPSEEPPTCDCEKSNFELRKEFRCVKITNFRSLRKSSLNSLIGKAQDDIACIEARCDADAPADAPADEDDNDDEDDEEDDDEE